MRTLGIDLSTKGGVTGVCEIDWPPQDRPSITLLCKGSEKRISDVWLIARMRDTISDAGWVAIDAPFGFPTAFTEAVSDWAAGNSVEAVDGDAPEPFDAETSKRWNSINRRITDAEVERRIRGLRPQHQDDPGGWQSWPLSSVVERITPTAIRCASLLSHALDPPVDRVHGPVVETYPIAALRIWLAGNPEGWDCLWKSRRSDGKDRASYKTDPEAQESLAHILALTTGVDPGGHRAALGSSDDLIDAFVCALMARCVSTAENETAPGGDLGPHTSVIGKEGWIHLPPEGATLADLRFDGPVD